MGHARPPSHVSAAEKMDGSLSASLAEALAVDDVDAVRWLLQRQLPNAPPEPSCAAASAAAVDNDARPTIEVLGLTLRSVPVMGEPVWPAALALGGWLRAAAPSAVRPRAIELGAGAGAPGLVAATRGWAASVVLTDGDESLLPLLRDNCSLNPPSRGTTVTCRHLDWRGGDHAIADLRGHFTHVLAADVLFSHGDIAPLTRACAALLDQDEPGARLLLARSTFFDELQPTLLAALETVGLQLLSTAPAQEPVAAIVLEFGWARRHDDS